MTINGFVITEQGPGWEYAYAADNPNTGYGMKFYTLEAAITWASMQ